MPDGNNPRAVIGGNSPPEPTPYEAMKIHLDDLLLEAKNWADGTAVESQAQADEAARLIRELQKSAADADKLRIEEKRPLDEQIAEIQARWNVYIADPKNKNPGKVWKAVDALKAAVKPFLDRLEAERQEAARLAREEAERKAREAAEAARAAAASDLAAQEEAEEKLREALRADHDAKKVENSRTQARGAGERAMGLRTVWKAHMTDRKAALFHYAAAEPDELVAFLQGLADRDVRNGKRTIPGFDVKSETVI